MNVQKFIRNEVSEMTRDEVVPRIAALDALLKSDPEALSVFPFSVLDIKSYKSKLISRLKQLDNGK